MPMDVIDSRTNLLVNLTLGEVVVAHMMEIINFDSEIELNYFATHFF